MAGATVTNNKANFTTSGKYVNLCSGLFGSYTAVSVEAWVTTTGINGAYARILQFGAYIGSGLPANKNSIAVRRESSNVITLIWFDIAGSEFACISSAPFDSQTSLHVVVTVSAGDYAKLYINGVLKGTTPAV